MRGGPSRQIIVPLVVACALFMQNLDSTVIATALPAIARSLNEDPLRLNLAITSYLLSLAVFIPISGWMADRFGARPVFCSAIAVFMLGSAGCGLAVSLPMLIASRILQGMGGAMMVPVGRLVLLRTVAKADLVRAMAFMSLPALLGPVIRAASRAAFCRDRTARGAGFFTSNCRSAFSMRSTICSSST